MCSNRWHTNITFPRHSSGCCSKYLANTIPAGHSWPPQPSLRSSWSFRGGLRREENEWEDVLAWRVGLGGMKDEGMSKEGVVGDGEGEVDMVELWDRCRKVML